MYNNNLFSCTIIIPLSLSFPCLSICPFTVTNGSRERERNAVMKKCVLRNGSSLPVWMLLLASKSSSYGLLTSLLTPLLCHRFLLPHLFLSISLRSFTLQSLFISPRTWINGIERKMVRERKGEKRERRRRRMKRRNGSLNLGQENSLSISATSSLDHEMITKRGRERKEVGKGKEIKSVGRNKYIFISTRIERKAEKKMRRKIEMRERNLVLVKKGTQRRMARGKHNQSMREATDMDSGRWRIEEMARENRRSVLELVHAGHWTTKK